MALCYKWPSGIELVPAMWTSGSESLLHHTKNLKKKEVLLKRFWGDKINFHSGCHMPLYCNCGLGMFVFTNNVICKYLIFI